MQRKTVLTMDEYIKRDFVMKKIMATKWMDGHDGAMAMAIAAATPAADVAPVVHGRWEWLGPNRLVTDCMCGTCSACKVRSKYIVNTMLCPNCGTKMDGGSDNG